MLITHYLRNTAGIKDITTKSLIENNGVSADIANVNIFGGETVIMQYDLTSVLVDVSFFLDMKLRQGSIILYFGKEEWKKLLSLMDMLHALSSDKRFEIIKNSI